MADSVPTWIPYLAYVAPVAWIMFRIGRSKTARQRAALDIHNESIAAGLTAPPSLHPIIDHAKCIGCEACVHACPRVPHA